MIETLLISNFKLVKEWETILSITRINEDKAIIISSSDIWVAERDDSNLGFHATLVAHH